MSDSETTSSPGENYLVRGVDASGRKATERVLATNAQGAIDEMTRRGYSRVEILTDDLDRSLPGGGAADEVRLSPATAGRLSDSVSFGWSIWLFVLVHRGLLLFALIPLVLFSLRRLTGAVLGWQDVLLGIMLLIVLAQLIVDVYGKPLGIFRRMQRRYIDGHFDEAQKLIDQFERASQGKLSSDFVAATTTEWRAKTLAKQGRVAQALALTESLHDSATIKLAFYFHVKAMVYSIAQQREEALECYRLLAEHDPNNPLGWLGMSDILAIHLDRPTEARECLERVKKLPVNPGLRDAMGYGEAIVLLAEKKYPEARAMFEQCLPVLQRQRRTTPIAEGLLAMARAQLAIACARMSDHATARAHFKKSRRSLEIHRADQLLARCLTEVPD